MLNIMHKHKKLTFNIPLPNMSSSEFFLINTLMHCSGDSSGSMFVSKLAEKLHISAPAVSKSLSSLENRGLILRTIDDNSRRNTRVSLTEKGKSDAEYVHNYIKEYMDSVIDEMGEDNYSNFINLFQMMIDIMETKQNKLKEEEKNLVHD